MRANGKCASVVPLRFTEAGSPCFIMTCLSPSSTEFHNGYPSVADAHRQVNICLTVVLISTSIGFYSLHSVRFFSVVFLHTFTVVDEVECITLTTAARYMAEGQLLLFGVSDTWHACVLSLFWNVITLILMRQALFDVFPSGTHPSCQPTLRNTHVDSITPL